MLTVFLISCLQGISFSLISRSRNRNNITYQVLASLIGNFLWYMTMRYLVLSEMSFEVGVPFVLGTTLGGLIGVKCSMLIENKLHATSDGHIKEVSMKKQVCSFSGGRTSAYLCNFYLKNLVRTMLSLCSWTQEQNTQRHTRLLKNVTNTLTLT